ncbi:MAG: 2-oxoacid:acceptor oxidoreductase subunit alpha [Patescibacteria group bacterium]|nr:2-oxoacid:acceptor oxidoreductase subunit alpha [Patescibacteria group bacterium]
MGLFQKKESAPVYTFLVGGQAGDGAREAGTNLARLVAGMGYEVFISVEYPSLIRGGHNFARFSFSAEKITGDYQALDAIVALNEETIRLHLPELKKDGKIFADARDAAKFPGAFGLPVVEAAKAVGAPPIARAALALGAVCACYGIDLKKLTAIFEEIFQDKAGKNIELATDGFDYFKENYQPVAPIALLKKSNKKIIDGNEALAEGMIAGGLKNYFAYPMTPSSSILHYLAKRAHDKNLKVIQPENEIAAVNMALGSIYAGARTATGSSAGGFALMLEAMAFAGIAELPIVVADSQRASTSTGVPTRVGQGDLDFVRHLPGEFPRVVLAPGDPEEAFLLGGAAMNLAWKYQTPVVVLLDKYLSENAVAIDLPYNKVTAEEIKLGDGPNYRRYQLSADGVSPLAFPGQKDTVVKINSYEHDEAGWITDRPDLTKAMTEKRFAKMSGIIKERDKSEAIKIYGDKNSDNVVLFWGSVKSPLLEALKHTRRPFKAVQVVWLEPLADGQLTKILKQAKKVVGVESNFTGQLAGLIREKTGVAITNKILKYDSLPFEPMDLAKQLDAFFR